MVENPTSKLISRYRKTLTKMSRDISIELVKEIGPLRAIDGFSVALLEQKLVAYGDRVVDAMRKLIVQGIYDTTTDTLAFYHDDLYAETEVLVPKKTLGALEHGIIKEFVSTPFKGFSFDYRVQKIRNQLRIVIRNMLMLGMGQKWSGKDLASHLNYLFISEVPQGAWSLKNAVELLMVSEMARAYQYTTMEFLNFAGVRYARFCLVPQHVVKDICDELANNLDERIVTRFKGERTSPRGVFRVDEFPEYPHPRAIFYIEPIYKIGFNPYSN